MIALPTPREGGFSFPEILRDNSVVQECSNHGQLSGVQRCLSLQEPDTALAAKARRQRVDQVQPKLVPIPFDQQPSTLHQQFELSWGALASSQHQVRRFIEVALHPLQDREIAACPRGPAESQRTLPALLCTRMVACRQLHDPEMEPDVPLPRAALPRITLQQLQPFLADNEAPGRCVWRCGRESPVFQKRDPRTLGLAKGPVVAQHSLRAKCPIAELLAPSALQRPPARSSVEDHLRRAVGQRANFLIGGLQPRGWY